MSMWRLQRILLRFPFIHRAVHRGDEACIVCRYVWRQLEADPKFVAAMAQGLADLDAGRFVRWEDIR